MAYTWGHCLDRISKLFMEYILDLLGMPGHDVQYGPCPFEEHAQLGLLGLVDGYGG